MKYIIWIAAIWALSQGDIQAIERFDYHTVRKKTTLSMPEIFEGEFLSEAGKARPQDMRGFGNDWSGNSHLLWDGLVGDSSRLEFEVAKAGKYAVSFQWTMAPDYGQFEVRLNGKLVEESLDLFSPLVGLARLGDPIVFELEAGIQRIGIKLISGNVQAKKFRGTGYLYGLDYIKLRDLTPKLAKVKEIKEPDAFKIPEVDFVKAQAIMKRHCFRCHGSNKVKGEINLEALTTRADVLKEVDLAHHAMEVLDNSEMPPEDELQPSKAERVKLASFFEGVINDYVSANTRLEPIVMRRLNRYEYNNAVRDLLCLLYTSPSPRDATLSRMPSSA